MAKNSNDDGLTARYEGPISDESGNGETRQVSTDEVPAGSVTEVVQWVSDDKARAAAALEVEEAKGDSARSTLIETLERLVD